MPLAWFIHQKIATKIVVCFGALIAIGLAVGATTFESLSRIGAAETWTTHTYQVLGAAEELTTALMKQSSAARAYRISGYVELRDRAARADAGLDGMIRGLADLTVDNLGQQTRIHDLDALIQTWRHIAGRACRREDDRRRRRHRRRGGPARQDPCHARRHQVRGNAPPDDPLGGRQRGVRLRISRQRPGAGRRVPDRRRARLRAARRHRPPARPAHRGHARARRRRPRAPHSLRRQARRGRRHEPRPADLPRRDDRDAAPA